MQAQLNKIYYGDCKNILSKDKTPLQKYWQKYDLELPEEFVDLIYMDPPFFSNKNYEVIWNDGAEIRCFNDSHWYIDGKRQSSINAYLKFMRERIELCYTVLKKTGTFYIHCDYHASHYLKCMLDNIFGYNNFRNEIIWYYKHMSNAKKDFARKHDTILRYTKTNNFVFNINEIREPYDKKTIKRYKNPVIFPGGYESKMNPQGKIPDDVWEIPLIRNVSKEKLGYPTQKPELLLERIIKASTNPGEIVMDPFCGCGTSIAVAFKLNRYFIGMDCSYTACKLMQERLKPMVAGEKIEIVGTPLIGEETRNMNHFDFQNLIICALGGRLNVKTGDKGIDGWDKENNPVQIKQSDKVGRQVVDQFSSAIRRECYQLGNKNKVMKGFLICYSVTSGVWDEIARLEKEENLIIKIITIHNKDSIEKTVYEQWYKEIK